MVSLQQVEHGKKAEVTERSRGLAAGNDVRVGDNLILFFLLFFFLKRDLLHIIACGFCF